MGANTSVMAFQSALLHMDRLKAAAVFESCNVENADFDALEQLIMKALENIGNDWENGIVSLSQVYMGGVICEELIEKYLSDTNITFKTEPKIAIAVLQDHHALGKRIVSSVLRAGGYALIDLGHGLSPQEIVEKTISEGAEVLLISVLMLPSALMVQEVVDLLRSRGAKTKVIVGGAPFRLDETLWQSVGADATARNGTDVIGLIEQLIKGGNPV